MNIFKYDNYNNKLKVDDHCILLIKEFSDLWEQTRNKCKEDITGIKRLRAYKEFAYIYLMFDPKSPYFEYLESEKHQDILKDTGLTDEEIKDKLFYNACKKYHEIINTSKFLTLIKTANKTLEKLNVFLENVDLDDRDSNGKPIFKAKDIINDIKSIGDARINLKELVLLYKKDMEVTNEKVRGDNTPGLFDK